ncbi:MAG: potassium-transporting ATPase subunit C [Microbacterium sp.]|nr:potassium-transporting ATPase subunit C [Microbacterium sp.]
MPKTYWIYIPFKQSEAGDFAPDATRVMSWRATVPQKINHDGFAKQIVVAYRDTAESFADAKGNPLPQWFQPRPSAAGKTGYDGTSSGGSNLGPENKDLITAITERRAQIAAFNGVSPDEVPADAVTASGSGLDPHISPAYALLQVDRVAAARDLPAATVRALVEAHIQSRDLGFLGEPRVNVLELNQALQGLED